MSEGEVPTPNPEDTGLETTLRQSSDERLRRGDSIRARERRSPSRSAPRNAEVSSYILDAKARLQERAAEKAKQNPKKG